MTNTVYILVFVCVLNVFSQPFPPQSIHNSNTENNLPTNEKHGQIDDASVNVVIKSAPNVKPNESKKDAVENILQDHIEKEKEAKGSVKKQLIVNSINDTKSSLQNSSEKTANESFKTKDMETGAVMRGIFVFVAIGMLFMIYVGCKTYRRKKTNVVVRKYGVRARRSDVEMEPLPLSEDEEDETVFDLGSLNRT